MTGEEIFRELGGIDSQLVLNAAPEVKVKERKRLKNLLPVAACFLSFVIVIGLVYNIAFQTPHKPTQNIVWGDSYVGDAGEEETDVPFGYLELVNVQVYEGKKVSNSVYCILSSDDSLEEMYYALIVTNVTSDLVADNDDVEYFMDSGIYAEIKNGCLYIFTTKQNFQALQLNDEQSNKYVFVLANKNAYE